MSDTQQKLNRIKAACRRAIELGKKATPGPWESRKQYFDRDEPASIAGYEVFPHTNGLRKPKDIGDWSALAECDNYEPGNKKNADFIAHARTFSPAAAQALLVTIGGLEAQDKDLHAKFGRHAEGNHAECLLQIIADEWPDE